MDRIENTLERLTQNAEVSNERMNRIESSLETSTGRMDRIEQAIKDLVKIILRDHSNGCNQ